MVLGAAMIIFGCLLIFASLATMIEQFNSGLQSMGDNDTAYNAGTFAGHILFAGLAGYLSYNAIKYGLRYVKGKSSRPETLDSDSIDDHM